MEPYILIITIVTVLMLISFLTVRHTCSLLDLYQILRAQEVQITFTQNYNALMQLLREGKIDANSYTFTILYELNTTMMNHTESSTLLEQLLITTKQDNIQNLLNQESISWVPEIKTLVDDTFVAINYYSNRDVK